MEIHGIRITCEVCDMCKMQGIMALLYILFTFSYELYAIQGSFSLKEKTTHG